MTEHINILSVTEVTRPSTVPVLIVGGVCILSLVLLLVYIFTNKTKLNYKKFITWYICSIVGGLVALLVSIHLGSFFPEPTGQHKYRATIDKYEMTVAEYEEFISSKNPVEYFGVYEWTE